MKAFAHDVFTYPLPDGHRFPLGKYRLVREGAEASPAIDVADARAATDAELGLAHGPEYRRRVAAGELTRREVLALGLPWSPELVERARRSVGATLMAAEAALADGVAANVGGGTHHAFADGGRGFCVFNDVVVTAKALRLAGRVSTVLVVDLDVHQGDGTHAAFMDDPETFTFSVNGFRTTRSGAYPATSRPTSPTAPRTSGTSTPSRGFSPRRSPARGRTSASTSPAPTRSEGTGSAASRSRRTVSPPATRSCATASPRRASPSA